MKNNVLVIGGAGYIGSHVVLALLKSGYGVTVFDNFSTGRRENLFPEAGLMEGDIRRYGDLTAAMKGGFHALVHLAAFKAVGESMLDPGKYAENNISGTVNILNAAVASGVHNVVFSSSAAVYGEPHYLPVDEDHPVNPENFYGFTKLEIERLLFWYDKLKGLRYAALRYFNASGYDPEGRIKGLEQNPQNLLPIIMEAAAGIREKLMIFGNDYATEDGTGVRDYIHVSDLADAHVRALAHIAAKDESLLLNLGSETGTSVLVMLETARRITGRPIPAEFTARRAGDPAKLVGTSARAEKVLGWKARHSGVESLVATTWRMYERLGRSD
ncbi:MAG: UDP-glucose 4-epimerase GalE [Spirochaetales bacterium]|nr:MAG: UDP-glucose 4-epimerase GalE [Spirochaetales bacterium]